MSNTEILEKIKVSKEKANELRKELSDLHVDLLKADYEKIKEFIEPIGEISLNVSNHYNDEGGTYKSYSLVLAGSYLGLDERCGDFLADLGNKPTEEQVEFFHDFSNTIEAIVRSDDFDGVNTLRKYGMKIKEVY
jgi:hypothetical protein